MLKPLIFRNEALKKWRQQYSCIPCLTISLPILNPLACSWLEKSAIATCGYWSENRHSKYSIRDTVFGLLEPQCLFIHEVI